MTFTIEQLEALKEGITPGPWKVRRDKWGGGLDCPEIMDNEDNLRLAAAAPALVDALIAEKRAHQELRKRIEDRIRELKQPLCSHMPEGDELDDYLEQWDRQSYEAEILTEILEGHND